MRPVQYTKSQVPKSQKSTQSRGRTLTRTLRGTAGREQAPGNAGKHPAVTGTSPTPARPCSPQPVPRQHASNGEGTKRPSRHDNRLWHGRKPSSPKGRRSSSSTGNSTNKNIPASARSGPQRPPQPGRKRGLTRSRPFRLLAHRATTPHAATTPASATAGGTNCLRHRPPAQTSRRPSGSTGR
jgi:hypothetical protein